MEVPAKIEFLKSAIATEQNTLRLQIALSALLFIVGLTVVVLNFVDPRLSLAGALKTCMTVGGSLVAASGFIPIFFSRPERVAALRSLLNSYQHQHVGGLSPNAKLDQYFEQYVANVLGG